MRDTKGGAAPCRPALCDEAMSSESFEPEPLLPASTTTVGTIVSQVLPVVPDFLPVAAEFLPVLPDLLPIASNLLRAGS